MYLLSQHARALRIILREECARQIAVGGPGHEKYESRINQFLMDLNKVRPSEETRALVSALADGVLHGNWLWLNPPTVSGLAAEAESKN